MRSDRWRRHWKLAVGFPLALALLVGVFGTSRVRAVSSSERTGRAALVTQNLGGQRDLFDKSVVHTISVRYDEAHYRRMLDAYFTSGDKGFVEADMVIDGVTVRSVGIRLKGNATLFGLRSADGRTAPRTMPAGVAQPAGGAAFPGPPPGGRPAGGPGGGPGGFGGFGGFGTTLSTEAPENLPWLVSFDEFSQGRRFQGHEEIALRPAQNLTRATVLNEAFSYAAIGAAGEPSPDATYSSFQVNGGPSVLRLVVQSPGQSMVDTDLGVDGALYKSLSTGNFDYRGEDPLAYATSFNQLTNRRRQDLQPVIDFVHWVNEATPAEFDDQLAQRVDVDSFARYVALQNVLLNFDDMAGPGQNYLLFYDVGTERFSVLTWDMNLALSGNPAQGPFDAGGFGGGSGGGGAGVGRLGGHVLKERFLASEAFTPAYERAYREVYRTLFVDGAATKALDELAAQLAAAPADLVDAEAVQTDIAQVRNYITNRAKALAADPVLARGA